MRYFPKTTTIFIVFFGCLFPLDAQIISPGGVVGYESWYASQQDHAGNTYWVHPLAPDDRIQPPEHPNLNEAPQLNFNPALPFGGSAAGPELALPNTDLSKIHIFTVYRAADTLYEKSIWSLEQDDVTRRILTTHRMADLANFQYLNFTQQPKGRAELSAYFLHGAKTKEPSAEQAGIIRIGTPPTDYDLPVRSFRGVLPEIIVYQRYLSPRERRQVESYLALKYGITLYTREPASYLNAAGQTIWNGLENADYHHAVTGIGRDDASSLIQKKSTSSEAPGLLTISYDSEAIVPDKHFLIWGDDQAALAWRPEKKGRPTLLSRNWLMTRFGDMPVNTTEVVFDTKALFSKLPEGRQYWLLVDRSGTGDFPVADVDYYPISRYTKDGMAVFDAIVWDTDGSGKDVFTLAAAPEMLVQFQLDAPHCQPAKSGNLQLTIQGGQPPFQMEIQFPDGTTANHRIQSHALQHIDRIVSGDYRLRITDALNHSYQEHFFVQSADAPLTDLADQYEIRAGERLWLDATLPETRGPVTYQWTGPNGFQEYTSHVEIRQAGRYQLLVTQQACSSQKEIEVLPFEEQNFRELALYPNPSVDGWFNLKVALERAGDIDITVYSADGKWLFNRRQSGGQYYHFRENIAVKGAYLIKVHSDQSSKTIPLLME